MSSKNKHGEQNGKQISRELVKGQLIKGSKTQGGNSLLKTALATGTVALASGASASLASLGLANYLVSQLTKPSRVNLFDSYNFTPYEFQADFEDVEFPTFNERMLSGWFLPHVGERRVIVAVSGYRGRKEDMLGVGIGLWRAGYNVLLFNYRGYGGTALKNDVLTLGHRELQDFQAAVKYVRQRIPNAIVGAVGASMGASVVLVATARDKDISAVWADSSFASQEEVISDNFSTITHLPSWPVVGISEKLFEWRTGHRYRNFSPVSEIGKIAPRPVFLLHGSRDTTVRIKHGHQLYEAAGSPKELWIEDVEHCGIYFANRQAYVQRAVAFFDAHLKTETTSNQKKRFLGAAHRQLAS